MKIRKAEFSKCAVKPSDFPTGGLPEIALVGRSNVGKSSLINSLVNKRGLAKTSSTPGKTRTINFYLLNDSFYLVDLPGFGYASVPGSERRSWKQMIEGYMKERSELRGVLVILDVRRDPGETEEALCDWIESIGLTPVVVLTKADKFSKGRRVKRASEVKRALGIDDAVLYSSVTGEGKDALVKKISEIISPG
jgi:GTP-binding protein